MVTHPSPGKGPAGQSGLRRTVVLLVLALASARVIAQNAEIVYLEGKTDHLKVSGVRSVPDFGDLVAPGDTLITGRDGLIEITEPSTSLITIRPDTVFMYRETETAAGSRPVLACVLGSITYRFEKLAGWEPMIQTGNSLAGIRGTLLTVHAGIDGSSLFIVEEGLVQVSAQGRSVLLGPDEGVEVRPGSPPGEKFTVLRGQIDYSDWNAARAEAVRADPAAAVDGIRLQLESYGREIASLLPEYEEAVRRLELERGRLETIGEREGPEARRTQYETVVYPLELRASYLRVNMRYHALSALSLRRYVLGRLYLMMRTGYMGRTEEQPYLRFLESYDRALEAFEREIVPYLVEADI
jgi:hypothetical protein